VARHDLVAVVPPVRVLDRVGLDVPAAIVGVPVGVDRPESYRAPRHPFHYPSNTLRAVSYTGPISPRAPRTDSLSFLNFRMRAPVRFLRQNSGRTDSPRRCAESFTTPRQSVPLLYYIKNKKTLYSPAPKVQSYRGSKGLRFKAEAKYLRSKESARHDLVAVVPPARVLDRAGLDVPAAAAGAPVGVDRPEVALVVADVGDVRPAVGEQWPGLALPLLREQSEELTQRDLALVGEFRDDRGVERPFEQLVDLDLSGFRSAFFLAAEVLLEAVAEIVDPRSRLLGVDLEVVGGREALDRGDAGRRHELQELLDLSGHDDVSLVARLYRNGSAAAERAPKDAFRYG